MSSMNNKQFDFFGNDIFKIEDEDIDSHGFKLEDYEELEDFLQKDSKKNKCHKKRITRIKIDELIEKRKFEKRYNDLFGNL